MNSESRNVPGTTTPPSPIIWSFTTFSRWRPEAYGKASRPGQGLRPLRDPDAPGLDEYDDGEE
ncbi:hypothetical protein GCM10020367_14480 [Streptomyces sannanensis]|uniref:Uncharacterized protein n=1 Tax=Streptomyces sannanensis TaxID=285536 RepID=A0ABP6S7J0_9ACTN